MGKVLVFGGSVFVGRGIVNRLVAEGHNVFVLNRGNHLTPEGAVQLTVDRNDPEQLEQALSGQRFDFVIDGSAYLENQTKLAIQNLLGKTDHFIHISSSAVYKKTHSFPVAEDAQRGTNDDWGKYSTQKYLCEERLFSAWKDYKFPITILRPFYLYGPTNNLNRETYVFKRLLQGLPIIIPAMGRPIVQFGHLDDLVNAILQLVNKKESFGQAYNISGKSGVTLKGWVETCAQIVGVEPKLALIECKDVGYIARQWFPLRDIHLLGSVEKIKMELGIEPSYNLAEGLKHTYEHLSKEELLKPIEHSEAELALIEKLGL